MWDFCVLVLLCLLLVRLVEAWRCYCSPACMCIFESVGVQLWDCCVSVEGLSCLKLTYFFAVLICW